MSEGVIPLFVKAVVKYLSTGKEFEAQGDYITSLYCAYCPAVDEVGLEGFFWMVRAHTSLCWIDRFRLAQV